MIPPISRRQILVAAATLPAAGALIKLPRALAAQARSTGGFSFPFIGDIHFDKLEYHDMEWMEREKPGDIRQVRNYSRITTEILPHLMSEIQGQVESRSTPFVLQVGDIVEGLCGTPELAKIQVKESLQFVSEAKLGAPLLFCKGNHDITGPGAREAFAEIFHPYLTERLETISAKKIEALKSAYYSLEYGNALFAFYDAYDEGCLTWLESTLDSSRAKHKFVVIHTPVAPYGARSTWHIYSKPREAERRARLLEALGRNRVIVLTGHIHKYNLLSRKTESGQFVQVAIGSVLPRTEIRPSDVLEGVAAYTPEQIRVEPNFSPATEAERKAALAAEAPFVREFEYAEAPGYSVLHVGPESVTIDIYTGIGRKLWKSHNLTKLLSA